MERRRFLQVMAIGGAGAALPRLVFAGSKRWAVDFEVVLAKALRVAKDAAHPLLVFVIPADEAVAAERGRLLGRWLHNAGYESLEDLALIDIVCAPLAALHAHGWEFPASTTEPCFVWIDTHPDEPVARALDVDPLSIAEVLGPPEPGFTVTREYDDRQFHRFEALTAALRAAVDWDARGEEYAKRAEALLDDEQKVKIANAIAHPRTQSFPESGRVAAYWRYAVRKDADKAERVQYVLRKQARARWIERSPAGAEWILPPRTDAELSDLPCSRGPCGLPATTPTAREFLRFLTDSAK